jgi:hypothetical protein
MTTSHPEQAIPPFNAKLVPEYTQAPNPGWALGQKVETTDRGAQWLEAEKQGWKTIDAATEELPYAPACCAHNVYLDPQTRIRNMYKLMISGIIPRPIAFVSSISEDGVENLAPFRFALARVLLSVDD